MRLFKKTYQVKPNTTGYLFRKNVFEKKLDPGVYKVQDWDNTTELFCLPDTRRMVSIPNQEVLTKDNIAFRFSFNYIYRITDGEKFLRNYPLQMQIGFVITEAERELSNIVQQAIRDILAEMDCETLNEKRNEIKDFKTEAMEQQAAELGIEIQQAVLRDITFPKSVQELFAKYLESKIRAKSELENARTTVATARALKNAAELMKDNDDIRFIQWLETIHKIADKGKHTFVIGDANTFPK